MKSNYKSLGSFIRQVKTRNRELGLTEPMGINISKFFMPSVANTNGTDLTKYRVVENGQFAYNPMHVGRDEVLPIALLKGKSKIIVSPAYTVFEIIDEKVLLPEYLMMWFRRKDFDRNAWFTTDNSVRGGFSWESLCEMQLPIPSPAKQQEIVDEYNTVVNRIKLNEELIHRLEETAQTLYKHWFEDFEFPMSKEYAESIGKPELEGKPYKSSEGEMVYNEELEKEIPLNWTYFYLNKLVKTQYGYTASADKNIIGPKFLRITDIANGSIDWNDVPNCKISQSNLKKYQLQEGDILIARTGASVGSAKRINKFFPPAVFASYLVKLKPIKNLLSYYIGLTVVSQVYKDYIGSVAGGSAQPQANAVLMTEYKLFNPPQELLLEFNIIIEKIMDLKELKELETTQLKKLEETLLRLVVTTGKEREFQIS